MRDLMVSVVIIMLVFISGYYSEKYLIDTGKELVNRLKVIEAEIKEDKMESFEELKDIKKRWDEVEVFWNMVTNHLYTDNIELAFIRLLISYDEDEKAECLVNIAEVVAIIEDTPRSEKIDWVNIF